MEINSNKIASIALFISIIAVPSSAYLSFFYAKKAFKYEIKEQKILEIIDIKDRFISDIELFGNTAKSIAEYEFGTNFTNRPYIAEYEKFYQKLFDMGLVNLLYNDIENLNSRNFDLFLSKFDPKLHDAYKAFELSENNPDINDLKKAHLVYQLFFENKFLEKLSKIQAQDIRNYYSK
jgi:hypothetical protein